ncbi:MAG TPA: hypothetical protein VID19_07440 [Candidatus Eremiobacteraceae bacterium]|jgi:hypothetical protein
MSRYDGDISKPVVSAQAEWTDIMCMSDAEERARIVDPHRRPARDLFQSLEVFLIHSGYEALVSASPDGAPPAGASSHTHRTTKAS